MIAGGDSRPGKIPSDVFSRISSSSNSKGVPQLGARRLLIDGSAKVIPRRVGAVFRSPADEESDDVIPSIVQF